jgi:hypothetical protein
VEYARDLGQVELWEESLRRSLERRGRPRRSSVELHQLRPARDLTLADVIERSSNYSQLRRQAAQRQAMPRPSAAISGVSAMALLAAATVPKLIGGGGGGGAARPTAAVQEAAAATAVSSHADAATAASIPRPAVHPPRLMPRPVQHRPAARPATVQRSAPSPTHAPRATTSTPQATIASVSHSSGGAALAAPKHAVAKPRDAATHPVSHVQTRHPTTTTSHTSGGAVAKPKAKASPTTPTHASAPAPAPVSSDGYVNPLAHASVTPERIDQGVDYSGSGTLTAIGAGRVIATSGGGWPGNFIEYRLTSGAYAGRYVYYAEGVAPVSGLHDGQSVRPGQPIATMSGGIEIGWGSGVGTQPLAQAPGQPTSTGVATAAGRSFSALIASLGGPPGKLGG